MSKILSSLYVLSFSCESLSVVNRCSYSEKSDLDVFVSYQATCRPLNLEKWFRVTDLRSPPLCVYRLSFTKTIRHVICRPYVVSVPYRVCPIVSLLYSGSSTEFSGTPTT